MYSVVVPSEAPVRLSGAVVTSFNKLIFPALWLGGLAGIVPQVGRPASNVLLPR